MFGRDSAQLPILDRRFLGNQVAGKSDFRKEFCRRARIDPLVLDRDASIRTAIARSAQEFLEETVVGAAKHFRVETRTTDLCLAGGVFLNVLLVRALEQRTGFNRIFVQPVAGNAGTALGALYLIAEAAC